LTGQQFSRARGEADLLHWIFRFNHISGCRTVYIYLLQVSDDNVFYLCLLAHQPSSTHNVGSETIQLVLKSLFIFIARTRRSKYNKTTHIKIRNQETRQEKRQTIKLHSIKLV